METINSSSKAKTTRTRTDALRRGRLTTGTLPLLLWPYLIVAIMYGACIGSFLNVVIYRMPAELSLFHPPSRCPKCKTPLAMYDNIPVLGWLWLRGKCRYCKVPISIQYPAIEALTGALFGLLFYVYYMTDMRPDFAAATLNGSYLVIIVHGVLVASLLAATLIDAKHYIIPISIPHTAIVFALVGLPLATWLEPSIKDLSVLPNSRTGLGASTLESIRMSFTLVPRVSGQWFGAAMGGALGIGVAMVLVLFGLLPRSFEGPQWDEPMPGTEAAAQHAKQREAVAKPTEDQPPAGENGDRSATAPPDDAEGLQEWLAPPGLKLEIGKELLFCLFPIVGAVLGWLLWLRISPFSPYQPNAHEPAWLRVLGGVVMGYLAGGGMIWGLRILGTLGFGKEAMGLGDVHLLAAIGAVLGPVDAGLTVVLAAFIAIAFAIVMFGVNLFSRGLSRPIPFGPFLAAGALAMMIFRFPVAAWVIGLFQIP